MQTPPGKIPAANSWKRGTLGNQQAGAYGRLTFLISQSKVHSYQLAPPM